MNLSIFLIDTRITLNFGSCYENTIDTIHYRIKECSDIPTNMIVFDSLPKFYVLCCTRIPKKRQKTVFGQEVFNTHGFECTHPHIRVFFLKIMISLLGY